MLPHVPNMHGTCVRLHAHTEQSVNSDHESHIIWKQDAHKEAAEAPHPRGDW